MFSPTIKRGSCRRESVIDVIIQNGLQKSEILLLVHLAKASHYLVFMKNRGQSHKSHFYFQNLKKKMFVSRVIDSLKTVCRFPIFAQTC